MLLKEKKQEALLCFNAKIGVRLSSFQKETIWEDDNKSKQQRHQQKQTSGFFSPFLPKGS